MNRIPLGALRAVAARLEPLGVAYCFVGGAVATLLVDQPELSPVRATDDVDVIIEVVTDEAIAALEARLREAGFSHDTSEGAPTCRWLLGNLTVDIMPTLGARYGLNTTLFPEALAHSTWIELGGSRFRVVSPPGFLATKHLAFRDRGRRDFYESADVEDFIAVVDGRAGIVAEVEHAPKSLRQAVITAVRDWVADADFLQSLSGQLPPDPASQARLPGLQRKLEAIAALGSTS